MEWSIIYDTDIHGGLSGLIAIKALRAAGEEILRHYSHFERVSRGQQPTHPVTNPLFLAQSLPQIIMAGRTNLILLDIPVNVMAPIDFINTIANYKVRDKRVIYIDHHEHSESYTRELFNRGIETIITGTSYDMSLVIPRIFGINKELKELEEWALIASLADFDVSIASKVDNNLERLVLEYLDSWWKNGWQQTIQVNPTFGSVGSIVNWILENGFTPRGFLEFVRRNSSEIPIPEHRTVGEITYITGEAAPGQAWKTTWKLNLLNGTKVAVSWAETPRGITVITAAYWKNPEIFGIVDEVVEEVSRGRPVVGHSGAKSILVSSKEEADMLAREVIQKLNEKIQSSFYTPKTVQLINEQRVANALHSDFTQIMRLLAQILQQQQEMYKEYLELKRKQVRLLEETQRHEYD